MTAPLHVEGSLQLQCVGVGEASLEASGAVICARIDRVGTGLTLARRTGLGAAASRRALREAARHLAASDLSLEVRVGDRLVALAGAGARSGLSERLLGLQGGEIRFAAILCALLRR